MIRATEVKPPYKLNFTMKNVSQQPMRVAVGGLEKEYADLFAVVFEERELGVGEEATATVEFFPRSEQAHEVQLPIFVDGDASKAYLKLDVVGSGRLPRLLFDRDEVVLPAVPLGIASEAQVSEQRFKGALFCSGIEPDAVLLGSLIRC